MSFTDEQIAALKAPLNKEYVKQRSQAGRALSYLEGWKVIEEANRIFGFGRWDRHTVEMKLLSDPVMVGDKWRVYYAAKAHISVSTERGMVARDGWGYGSGIDKDVGQAHESAIKEAETDAMKRALMTFGNPFGLALYDKEQRNVAEEPKAAPATIAKPEPVAPTLIATLNLSQSQAELSRWATENAKAIEGLPAPEQATVRESYRAKLNALKIGKVAA